MGLPQQPLLDTKHQTTPEEFAKLLREEGAFFFWPKGDFWVVTDYRLAEVVMKSPDYSADRSSFFISRMPNMDLRLITDFFGVISKMMVMSDAPEHTNRRKFAGVGVDDDLMEYYQPRIDATVNRLLNEAESKGSLDFVSDVAEKLPSMTLADLFCIDEADRENFYRWSNNMTQFFGGASRYRNEDGVEVNQSALHLKNYFADLVKKRRAEPQDDFLSTLLAHQTQFNLDDGEIISQAIMMLVAGQITTTDQFCNNLFTLLTVPRAWAELGRRPDCLKTALEEANRLDPAVTFLFRVVKRPTTLGGVELKEQDVIFVSTHAVNRDPVLFPSPETLVLDRKHNPHFAYGHGPHFCLGAKLARMQMVSCFRQLLERYPQLSLHPSKSALRKHHSLAFSGFESLPLDLVGKVSFEMVSRVHHQGVDVLHV